MPRTKTEERDRPEPTGPDPDIIELEIRREQDQLDNAIHFLCEFVPAYGQGRELGEPDIFEDLPPAVRDQVERTVLSALKLIERSFDAS